MSNCCRGELKIRGTKKNIEHFLLEGLEPIDEQKTIEVIHEEDMLIMKISDNGYGFYLKNTDGQFIEQYDIAFSYAEDDQVILVMPGYAGSGSINAEELAKLSKDFMIDFKIYGFEYGIEFNQDIEIINGVIVKDEVITFDNYAWDCICPNMGG